MKSTKVTKSYLYFITLFLGIVSSFSLPPYNFFFLNFITLPALLYILINHISGRLKYFLTGWFFGLGYFISNIYWITNSLKFDESFKFLIPFALLIIPSFLAIFYGLVTLLSSFFNLKNKISSILIFAVSFGTIEFLRGSIFGGFPWNLIVFSFSNYLPVLQILSYLGTYTLNLLSITFFLLPIIIFFQYKIFTKSLIFLISLALIFINVGYGIYNIKKFKETNYEILNSVIRVVSPNVPIERFLNIQDPEKNIIEMINLSEPNSSEKTIFVYPEGIISTYLNDLKYFKDIFSKNYNENHTIILGINDYTDGKIFNSLIAIDNNTELLFKYNKNKLVPFGEFIPFENFFKKIGLKKITRGYQSFSYDDKREVLNINQIKFIPIICYEIIYSGKINIYKKDFDILLNISEDGWFGKSIGPKQHLSHSIFRSIEEGKNVVRSTNNGISAYINPKGQIIKEINEKGYFDVKKIKRVNKTYFSKKGNKIFFYFVIFYINLIIILKVKEKNEKRFFIHK